MLAAWIASLSVRGDGADAAGRAAGQPATDLAGATEPNPLPGLPRPPDQPGSLLQPAPAGPAYACPQPECPYFQTDPRLDCTELPHILDGSSTWSWASSAATSSTASAKLLPPIAGVVHVPMATLEWAGSPRFELGYRLPSGFGEFDVAYRFLSAEGTGTTPDPTAAPTARPRWIAISKIQVGDLDYASHETSLGADVAA